MHLFSPSPPPPLLRLYLQHPGGGRGALPVRVPPAHDPAEVDGQGLGGRTSALLVRLHRVQVPRVRVHLRDGGERETGGGGVQGEEGRAYEEALRGCS